MITKLQFLMQGHQSGLKTGGLVGLCLKTGSAVVPKNSKDGGT